MIKNIYNTTRILSQSKIICKNKQSFNYQFSVVNQQNNENKYQDISQIPDIKDFMKSNIESNIQENSSFQDYNSIDIQKGKKYTIKTYGCQMNENDSEIVHSILQKAGYIYTDSQDDTDILLFNTCAIRESAEAKIWKRLEEVRGHRRKDKKKIITGVLGCMAERLKEKLVEKNKIVDLIAGPDAYRDLPHLLQEISPNDYQINVQLSLDETYANITPVRINKESKQAFVSIMRGCNNMCAFCIVPFTRGRERSRALESIIQEIEHLQEQGVKEVTLLGQNVNSYFDAQESPSIKKTNQQEEQKQLNEDVEQYHQNSRGFQEMYKLREGEGPRFSDLLEAVAQKFPEIRFRFTSPHPKDFPDSVLNAINNYPNIAKNIHMPAQAGSDVILKKMRRNHTKESYLQLVDHIKQVIPGVTLSSDFIAGFCGETEEMFQDTIDLIEYVKYEQAFLFAYSMRERTHAHRKYVDDVPEETKKKRLQRMIDSFHKNQEISTKQEIGRFHLVLIDGKGKKEGQLRGRTDTNRICVIDQSECSSQLNQDQKQICEEKFFNQENSEILKQLQQLQNQNQKQQLKNGDFVICYVYHNTIRSLFCEPIAISSITEFAKLSQNKPFVCNTFYKQQQNIQQNQN